MAKKKVEEKPELDLESKVAELQEKRAQVTPQEQIEIDKKLAELTA